MHSLFVRLGDYEHSRLIILSPQGTSSAAPVAATGAAGVRPPSAKVTYTITANPSALPHAAFNAIAAIKVSTYRRSLVCV